MVLTRERRVHGGLGHYETRRPSYHKTKQHKSHKRVSVYKEMRHFYRHLSEGAMDIAPKVFYRTLIEEIDRSKTYGRLIKIAKAIFNYEDGIGSHTSDVDPRHCNSLDNTLKRKATKLHCFDQINVFSIQHQLVHGPIPFGGVADNHDIVSKLEEMQEHCDDEERLKFLRLLNNSHDFRQEVETCYSNFRRTGSVYIHN